MTSRNLTRRSLLGSIAIAAAISFAGPALSAEDTIKIGVLATSEGNLAFGMDEAKAAIAVALGAREGDVG